MKKSLLLFMIITGFVYCSFGQNKIENSGFELWEDAGSSVHEPVDWNSIQTWTRFSTPFNYLNSDKPEYILIILTSGNGLKAVDGSLAYFDALELKFNSGNDKK